MLDKNSFKFYNIIVYDFSSLIGRAKVPIVVFTST